MTAANACTPAPDALAGYPAPLVAAVTRLLAQGRLGAALREKYPQAHAVRSDRALYDYVDEMKREYLRNAGVLSRVAFDSRMQVVEQALGMHRRIARVQGTKLKSKREIRVASLFKATPPEFLRMIVVHELAHLRFAAHDKDFYQLCRHIEPAYHEIEFDLRAYLVHLELRQAPLWPAAADEATTL